MIPHTGIFFYFSKTLDNSLDNSNYEAYTVIHSNYEIITITLNNICHFERKTIL